MASIPFLSIVRIAAVDTRRRTHRPSLAIQKRWERRFGLKSRFGLLFAWETLFPDTDRLPVTWQIPDIASSADEFGEVGRSRGGAQVARSQGLPGRHKRNKCPMPWTAP